MLPILLLLLFRFRTTCGAVPSVLYAEEGGQVSIPCRGGLRIAGDQPTLVLWYRESKTEPVYSYDTREGSWQDGEHWKDQEVLGARAHFKIFPQPPLFTTSKPDNKPRKNKEKHFKKSVSSKLKILKFDGGLGRKQLEESQQKNSFLVPTRSVDRRIRRLADSSLAESDDGSNELVEMECISSKSTNCREKLELHGAYNITRDSFHSKLKDTDQHFTGFTEFRPQVLQYSIPPSREENVYFHTRRKNHFRHKQSFEKHLTSTKSQLSKIIVNNSTESSYDLSILSFATENKFQSTKKHLQMYDYRSSDSPWNFLPRSKQSARGLGFAINKEKMDQSAYQSDQGYENILGAMVLEDIRPSDHGGFTCRVEYRRAPTSYSTVKVFVLLPPGNPTLSWRGQAVSGGNLGPVKEGSYVHVTCSSAGGRPNSIISWWKTGKKLEGVVRQTRDSANENNDDGDINEDLAEDTSASKYVDGITVSVDGTTPNRRQESENKTAQRTTRSSGTGRLEPTTNNRLLLSTSPFPTPLLKDGTQPSPNESVQTSVSNTISLLASRDLLHTPIICQASVVSPTPDISLPSKTTAVVLNITMPPVRVWLDPVSQPAREGAPMLVRCTAAGSHPPAVLTLRWRGKRLTRIVRTVTDGGNVSRVTVTLRPQRKDDGGNVTCYAENEELDLPPLNSSITINVAYPPSVRAVAGKGVMPSRLLEGATASLRCLVDSRPQPSYLTWLKDDTAVISNMAGVTIDGNVLLLKPVSARHAGSYSCLAKNTVGTSTSNPVNVTVLYTPRCNHGWDNIMELTTPGEPTHLTCQILAWPVSDVSVTWSIVHSDGQEVDLHEGDFLNLDYIPGSNTGSQLRKLQKSHIKTEENRGKRRATKWSDSNGKHYPYDLNHHVRSDYAINETKPLSKLIGLSPIHSIYSPTLPLMDESYTNFGKSYLHIDSINITLNFTSESTTVLCRARNSIGIQETPCRIRLSQAEAPPVSLLTSVAAESTKSVLNCSSEQVVGAKTVRVSCPLERKAENSYEIFFLLGWSNNTLLLNVTSQSLHWMINNTLTPSKLKMSVTASNGTNRVQYKVNLTSTIPEDGSTGQRPLLVRPNTTRTDKNTGQALDSNAWWHMPVLGAITSLLLVLVFLVTLIIIMRRRKTSLQQQPCHDTHSCLAVTTGCSNRRHSEIGMSTELLLATVEPAVGALPTKGILKQSTRPSTAATTATTDFSVDNASQHDTETTLSLSSPLENAEQCNIKATQSSLQRRDLADSNYLIKCHLSLDNRGGKASPVPAPGQCRTLPKTVRGKGFISAIDGVGERDGQPDAVENMVLTSMCSGSVLVVGADGASAYRGHSTSYEQLPTVTGYMEKVGERLENNLCTNIRTGCGLQRTNSMPRRLIENTSYFIDPTDGQSPVSPLLSETVITSASSSQKYRTVLSQEHKMSRAETSPCQHPSGTTFPYNISSSISNIFRPPRKPPRPADHFEDSTNQTNFELINVNCTTVPSSSIDSRSSDGLFSHIIKSQLPNVGRQSSNKGPQVDRARPPSTAPGQSSEQDQDIIPPPTQFKQA